jgi:6-phosphogluconolactonase
MEQTRDTLIFDDKAELEDFLLKKWQELSEECIKEKGGFTAALSGGNTPEGFYKKLAGCKDLCDWSRTHIFIVDERFVPTDDIDSNYRMIRETLLGRVPLPPDNVHPIPTDEPDPETAADKYEKELRNFFAVSNNAFPIFDLVMLGMGEDGHTASLFPRSEALEENKSFVYASFPPSAKTERISLTLPVINSAKNVIFVVTGSDKAKVVREVVEGRNESLPAAMVMPEKGRLLFLLDRDAAMFLKRSHN